MTGVIIILSVVCAVLAIVAFVLYDKCNKKNVGLEKLSQELQSLTSANENLRNEIVTEKTNFLSAQKSLSELSVDNARLKERLEMVSSQREALEKEAENRFKVLASDIFADQSEKFRQNSEMRLFEILKPLRENISEFKKTIIDNYTNEAKDRHVLSSHIQELMKLNDSIGKDARGLTEALKGNTKVQGDWGEMILDTILEKSGLVRDENYFVQETRNENGELLVDENGRQLRPDVVVCLPDKKFVVIDSKVSLTAYTNYVNAEDEESRENYGKAHIASVRSHVKELENKKYQDYVGVTPDNRIDYVLMFIPNEHAYMLAMSLDKQLWQDTYDKRIVIISPAHVISTLRLIAQLWTRDKQTKNALKIAEESGKLYDKFYGFVEDMKNIETGLTKAQTAYTNAFKKLSSGNGNLISKVENLKSLGAKASKSLPSAE